MGVIVVFKQRQRRALICTANRCLLVAVLCSPLASLGEPIEIELSGRIYVGSGELEVCLSSAEITRLEVIDRQHIVVAQRSGEYFLNTLPRPCHALARYQSVSFEHLGDRICDVDWLRVSRPFMASKRGFYDKVCGLGNFERLVAKPLLP